MTLEVTTGEDSHLVAYIIAVMLLVLHVVWTMLAFALAKGAH